MSVNNCSREMYMVLKEASKFVNTNSEYGKELMSRVENAVRQYEHIVSMDGAWYIDSNMRLCQSEGWVDAEGRQHKSIWEVGV